jgi:hypothetical protein
VVDTRRGVGVSARRWTEDELRRVGGAVELDLAVRRRDGESRPFTTMWVCAGGIERDVTFAETDPGVHDGGDSTYHAKYDRFGPGPVGHVTRPDAHPVTIRLIPGGS